MASIHLTSAEAVIRRLFDPRYKDKEIPPAVKYQYLQHYLQSRWEQICGKNLARSCYLQKIDGSEMYICTANSLMANELYMMQGLFLQKINAFLAGRVIIKKIYFHTAGAFTAREKSWQEEKYVPAAVSYSICPKCGAKMRSELKQCSICAAAEKQELRRRLAELLCIQPWLHYDECQQYYKCDKILFTIIKDDLKNYYFERVRMGYADKKENLLAVLFLTGKHPEELTDSICENSLRYLRRDSSVSASRSRLYGKK